MLDEYLAAGLTQHSTSPYASLVVIIPKKSGGTRLTINCKKLKENSGLRAETRRILRQRAILLRKGRKASVAARVTHLHDRRAIRVDWKASLTQALKTS